MGDQGDCRRKKRRWLRSLGVPWPQHDAAIAAFCSYVRVRNVGRDRAVERRRLAPRTHRGRRRLWPPLPRPLSLPNQGGHRRLAEAVLAKLLLGALPRGAARGRPAREAGR